MAIGNPLQIEVLNRKITHRNITCGHLSVGSANKTPFIECIIPWTYLVVIGKWPSFLDFETMKIFKVFPHMDPANTASGDVKILIENGPVEIARLPIKHGDFP